MEHRPTRADTSPPPLASLSPTRIFYPRPPVLPFLSSTASCFAPKCLNKPPLYPQRSPDAFSVGHVVDDEWKGLDEKDIIPLHPPPPVWDPELASPPVADSFATQKAFPAMAPPPLRFPCELRRHILFSPSPFRHR